ncbi:MAG: xanthine dehydrogenase family protein subunit M [Clostridiales bacterium]|jgi:carbon-monoxide dehydrogenase medium subunit|nr:xanthine dehydrogenase family protein subunit M [Clostridiales bacterium]
MIPNVEYLKPKNLQEALELMEREGSVALAGGTDVIVNMRDERLLPKALIDIKGLEELKGIKEVPEGVWIGALELVQDAVENPLTKQYTAFIEGAGSIGCLEIRYRATIGGNICNGSPSADSLPGLLLYDAKAVIASKEGERTVSLESFLLGPGKVDLKKGELLKAVILPKAKEGSASKYYRRTRVKGMDLSSVSVAVYAENLGIEGKSDIRIALGAVMPTVARARKGEAVLYGQKLTDELLDEAIDALMEDVNPRKGSLRATPEYKKKMVRVLIKKAISEIKGGVSCEA